MAFSESSQNNLVLASWQERALTDRFTKKNSQELAFAVEMMAFVMKEKGEFFDDSEYSKISGESYPSRIDEEMVKFIRFVMKKYKSSVDMEVRNCFHNKPRSYPTFRNFANATCLKVGEKFTKIEGFLYFSVVLPMMCIAAFKNGFAKAPNLGIVLLSRTLSKFDPELWDNMQAAAQRLSKEPTALSEVERVVEKGMTEPSLSEICDSFMTFKEERNLLDRFTSENSQVLVFARELMSFVSFVMQEGQQVKKLVCTSSSEVSCPSLINDAMKDLIIYIMEEHKYVVDNILHRNCKMKLKSSYKVFRTYANAVSLRAEQEMLNNIFEFLVFSVLLAIMCLLANDADLLKAPELGIVLICRTHYNLCLHSTPELWDDLKAQAQRACEVLGVKTYVEKGSKVTASSTVSNETESKRTFQCSSCNFHSIYENCVLEHMKVHKTLPIVDRTCSPLNSSPTARYCEDCEILFLNAESYQVHKKFYCKAVVRKSFRGTHSPYLQPTNLQFQQPPTNLQFQQPPTHLQFQQPPTNLQFQQPPTNLQFQQQPPLQFQQQIPSAKIAATTAPTTSYGYNKIFNQPQDDVWSIGQLVSRSIEMSLHESDQVTPSNPEL